MENVNRYSTRDLAEASALLASEQTLLAIERNNSICWFVFENSEVCKSLSSQFFFGELLVNARTYSEAMIRLKNMIFSK